MVAQTLRIPTMSEIADRLMSAQVQFAGRLAPLRELIADDRRSARERRSAGPDAIFRHFAAALLERNVSGASYLRRLDVFSRRFGDPRALTKEHAVAMLRESGCRYPSSGADTLLQVTQHLTEAGFSWPRYLAEAEAKWDKGFSDDPLKKIKGVGDKTRDFALSEFSDHYCAPDLHVCRMMARTGLILHGYGNPGISTVEYTFVRRVIGQLARSTGWPGSPDGLSPAHIDRVFWYYGQDRKRCDANPDCGECPARDVCLTGKYRPEA